MKGMHPPNDSYYMSLTRKMILIVIVVSLTPMILVSAMILDEFEKSYREKVLAHLSVVVQKHKVHIDSFLQEKLEDIQLLSGSATFAQFSDERFLQETLAKLQRTFGLVFEDLGVIDSRGLQIAYAGPFKLIKAKYADATWFNKAIEQDFYISDVFLGLRGLPHFIVAVKHFHESEPWLLRATIDFVAFKQLVENLRIGNTGVAFIVNREGEFQTKPHSDRLIDHATLQSFIEGSRKPDEIHIEEGFDINGHQQIIRVSALLKGGDWVMIFQQERDDAFSDFHRTQSIAILIVISGGLVILTMAVLLSSITVSRIAKADREKEMMNQQVIETGKLASIGELAAGIAHEINNPVAIMVEEAGWMQDLLEEEELSCSSNLEEFSKSLKQINTQGKRCKEITHKLLSFARKTDSRVQDVQVNEMIQDVVGLSAQRAKYANVAVQTDLSGDLPFLKISSTEFQQVLLNLINNALDAMDKTGGSIQISSRLEGRHINIRVADTGPGIPAANLSRIFDPFFTTKPVGKGTGLGLSICYGIVKKMGGEIDVDSVVNEGTTFHIRIPVPENFETESKPQSPGPADLSSEEN